jgi:MFS family permease
VGTSPDSIRQLTHNVAGQFYGPARLAVIGDVVEGTVDRTRAIGIGQATAATAAIIGPPLAAPLLFTVGSSGRSPFLTLRASRISPRC